mmetsp:Transcript_48815/g.93363  ORF Transcript_48815/g.93363 Transcript_48815/m.93363 type:complete len:203 (+) Transcript_48815:2565-3173(+)
MTGVHALGLMPHKGLTPKEVTYSKQTVLTGSNAFSHDENLGRHGTVANHDLVRHKQMPGENGRYLDGELPGGFPEVGHFRDPRRVGVDEHLCPQSRREKRCVVLICGEVETQLQVLHIHADVLLKILWKPLLLHEPVQRLHGGKELVLLGTALLDHVAHGSNDVTKHQSSDQHGHNVKGSLRRRVRQDVAVPNCGKGHDTPI